MIPKQNQRFFKNISKTYYALDRAMRRFQDNIQSTSNAIESSRASWKFSGIHDSRCNLKPWDAYGKRKQFKKKSDVKTKAAPTADKLHRRHCRARRTTKKQKCKNVCFALDHRVFKTPTRAIV